MVVSIVPHVEENRSQESYQIRPRMTQLTEETQLTPVTLPMVVTQMTVVTLPMVETKLTALTTQLLKYLRSSLTNTNGLTVSQQVSLKKKVKNHKRVIYQSDSMVNATPTVIRKAAPLTRKLVNNTGNLNGVSTILKSTAWTRLYNRDVTQQENAPLVIFMEVLPCAHLAS